MKKSFFITFEGPEGSGKSTHSRQLFDFLKRKGFSVLRTREPGGTLIGERIRRVLLAPRNKDMSLLCEMLLYMAARAQIMREKILPGLKKGKIVICDRFLDATVAYQGYAGGMDIKIIKEIGRIVTGDVRPDLIFLLDINAREGLMRSKGKKDRMERKPLAYHKKVRSGYLAIAKNEPARVKVVHASGSIIETQECIRNIAMDHINSKCKSQNAK